ncbi:MAG: 2-hydroxyacid dehydrogenase [Anaerovoracaceae bacterium]|jgi:phosphoglycerate dehydrogenase-like enzyme
MHKKVILLTNCYDEGPLQIVRAACPDEFELLWPADARRDSLLMLAPRADYLLVSGRQKINEELIGRAERLQMVQRTGVGIDMIDLDALRRRALPLYINAGVNAQSVAEYTVLLMLSCLRRYPAVNSELKAGTWKKQANGIRTHEIRGRRVGLIGLGRIGRRTAAMLRAMGAEVGYHDVRRSEEAERELGLVWLERERLLRESQVISLHCPLTDATRHLIDADALRQMRSDAVLINTARGGLIDQNALAAALRSGAIRAAALDVFEEEPVPADHLLLQLENAYVSPHIGGVTRESFTRMMDGAFGSIWNFEHGNLQDIQQCRYDL